MLLQLINVGKRYKKKIAADGLNLAVHQGDILGLAGMNGAGKSTTISMIATLLKPDTGDILYKGESIIARPGTIRSEMGFVPQETALYTELSGRDNLTFWGRVYHINANELKERIKEVQELTGLDDEALKAKVRTYSGGMQRRLNIGAALLHRPELVVMDEPTVGIDVLSRNRILKAIQTLSKKGVTVIYSGHYLEEMEALCSRFCILDAGKIVRSGTKEEMLDGGSHSLEQYFTGSL